MNKEVFEKEISMCRDLSKKNGGSCNWGECEKCGVIPLLHKLHEGKVYEDRVEIEKLKKETLHEIQ